MLAPRSAADADASPTCVRAPRRSARALRSPCLAGVAAATSEGAAEASLAAATQAGCVLTLGEPGSWDDAAVGFPVVRCYVGDDEQRWFMWYSGRTAGAPAAGGVDAVARSSGSVGVAISQDGIHWARGADVVAGARGPDAAADVGTVMGPNGDWWTFDTCHMAPTDVQVLSNSSVSAGVGVYWMFYTGGDYEPVTLPEGFPGAGTDAVEGLRMRPGLAMSQDGRNWARIEAEHHTGALFDVGAAGEPDSLFVSSPQVLAVGPGDMRMFYTSWDPASRRFVVLLATSPDGFKWTKKGVVFDPAAAAGGAAAAGAFDALGAAAVSVVRDIDNRQFLMLYEAVATDNRRSVGLAVSRDGAEWRRYGSPVLAAEAGAGAGAEAWDGGDVGAPCAVSMSAGRWRLYYAGRRHSGAGPWQGVGLALSTEGGAMFEGVPVDFRRRVSKAGAASAAE